MRSIRARLSLSDLYIRTQRENLLAQANLIAAGLQDSDLPNDPIQPYSQTANVLPGVHTRLISDSGAVVVGLPLTEQMIQLSEVESFASIPPVELIQRPVIDSAVN